VAVPPAIEWLWKQFDLLHPAAQLGGIYANKSGYHNTRNNNVRSWPGNYSYAQYAVDREGAGDYASAIDLTFPDAQARNYANIATFSRRLHAAGQAGRAADPRTVYMREFYGNTDGDTAVEGWDYARHSPASSDSSHLWHIHISIHRKYANDQKAMRAILSILKGETPRQWLVAEGMVSVPPADQAEIDAVYAALHDGRPSYLSRSLDPVQASNQQIAGHLAAIVNTMEG
jgi:hypothetical protein